VSAAARPWWASEGDAPDPSQDPLDAHRAARRGPTGTPGVDEAASEAGRTASGADEAAGEPTATEGPAAADGHGSDVCGVCPLCTGMRALQASHPELVGHLTEAARHLSAAVRTVLGDLTASAPGGRPAPSDEDPLEHIDLD